MATDAVSPTVSSDGQYLYRLYRSDPTIRAPAGLRTPSPPREPAFEGNRSLPNFHKLVTTAQYGLMNSPGARRHYVSVLRNETVSTEAVTYAEDQRMQHYFRHSFPSICLERLSGDTGIVRRVPGWRNTMFLDYEMVKAVDQAAGLERQVQLENIMFLFLAVFYHETAHCLWGFLNPTKLCTPEKLAYYPTLNPGPGQGESGYVVEASFFGGVLAPMWAPGTVISYSNISHMVIHKKMVMPGQPWIELSRNYVGRVIARFLEEKYVAGPLPVREGGLTLCLAETPPQEWRLNILSVPSAPHAVTMIETPIGWMPFSISSQVPHERYRRCNCWN